MTRHSKIGILAVLGLFLFALSIKLLPLSHPLSGYAFSKVIRDRHGHLLRLVLTEDQKYRLPVRIADLPRAAIDKILAYEDRWFWYHPGINIFADRTPCV